MYPIRFCIYPQKKLQLELEVILLLKDKEYLKGTFDAACTLYVNRQSVWKERVFLLLIQSLDPRTEQSAILTRLRFAVLIHVLTLRSPPDDVHRIYPPKCEPISLGVAATLGMFLLIVAGKLRLHVRWPQSAPFPRDKPPRRHAHRRRSRAVVRAVRLECPLGYLVRVAGVGLGLLLDCPCHTALPLPHIALLPDLRYFLQRSPLHQPLGFNDQSIPCDDDVSLAHCLRKQVVRVLPCVPTFIGIPIAFPVEILSHIAAERQQRLFDLLEYDRVLVDYGVDRAELEGGRLYLHGQKLLIRILGHLNHRVRIADQISGHARCMHAMETCSQVPRQHRLARHAHGGALLDLVQELEGVRHGRRRSR